MKNIQISSTAITMTNPIITDSSSNSKSHINLIGNDVTADGTNTISNVQSFDGSLVKNLTDHFTQSLNTSLQRGIHTLPMLLDKDAKTMLQRLQKSYYRNIDLFELYCLRNIFTLENVPSGKRKALIRLLNDENWEYTPPPRESENIYSSNDNGENDKSTFLPLPKKIQDIPSPAKVQLIQQQLLGRRQHLASLQLRQKVLQERIEQLKNTNEIAQQVASDVQTQHKTIVPQVSETLQNITMMQQLQQQGLDVQNRMQQHKRQREQENQYDTTKIVTNPIPIPPKSTRMEYALRDVKERYQQDCTSIPHNTNNILKWRSLLVQENPVNE